MDLITHSIYFSEDTVNMEVFWIYSYSEFATVDNIGKVIAVGDTAISVTSVEKQLSKPTCSYSDSGQYLVI